MFVHLWLKFSGEAARNSFIAANELSTMTGWPNRDTEWMSPYLISYLTFNLSLFLAVQNSSIGDLVTHSLTNSVTFTFAIQRAILKTCDH